LSFEGDVDVAEAHVVVGVALEGLADALEGLELRLL
jgi:hypothetical protein